jgi:hypothetical protein
MTVCRSREGRRWAARAKAVYRPYCLIGGEGKGIIPAAITVSTRVG